MACRCWGSTASAAWRRSSSGSARCWKTLRAGAADRGADDQPGRLDDLPVEVDAAGRAGAARLEGEGHPVGSGRAKLWIVVAGNEEQRHVQPADEVLQVVEGQVPAAQDQVGP